MRLDAASAECLVHTFKEGLLSAIAHDLEIRVDAFAIMVDEDRWRIEGRFDARSLRVVGAVRGGSVAPGLLSDADKRTIEGNIVRDVLHAERFPEIRYASERATARGDEVVIDGVLTLHGREQPLAVSARRDGERWVGEANVRQPDFGITPYSAMLGTLRIAPDVIVRVVVPRLWISTPGTG